MITKELLPSKDAYLQFTEDELLEFGIKQGDKFSVKIQDDGFLLEKYKDIELDINDFDIDTLKMLVLKSFQEDITCNQVLINVLQEYIDKTTDDELFQNIDYTNDGLSTLYGVNSADYVLPTAMNYAGITNSPDEIKDPNFTNKDL
jgi:bifunctional DNA-binding transcriptional regulator/antitoxin component of YhaV-PrlF toxin-antitoxin module